MKTLISVLTVLFLLTGCGHKADNITFSATIEDIRDNGIIVTTTDGVGFEKASVGYDKGLKIPFNLIVGQTVEIEAFPEIRESEPVQITAVKISLKEENKKTEYKKITPSEAMEMMGENAVILDVRPREDFAEGHIPDAISLPRAEVAQRAGEVFPSKDSTILIYCKSGKNSKLAAEELIQMGYTNVYDFGGIIDWTGEVVK